MDKPTPIPTTMATTTAIPRITDTLMAPLTTAPLIMAEAEE